MTEKAKSLAARTPGALTAQELKLPEVFTRPSAPVQSRYIAPYVAFIHPKRADEWARVHASHPTAEEGEMFLITSKEVHHLDPLKANWLCHKQYWARANPSGEVLEVSFEEQPKPFKEHVEAVILVHLEGDRIVPANMRFRSTKCPAAKHMSDALEAASSPNWGEASEEHRLTMAISQPFCRFYGLISLGPTRTSKESGLPYTPAVCTVKPTGPTEWRALSTFSEDESSQEALQRAADRFTSLMEDLDRRAK